MNRRQTTAALIAATASTAASLLAGCQSATATQNDSAIALGAGDRVGSAIRAQEVVATGRDAWDRDRLIALEAIRLAEAIRLLEAQAEPDRIVIEPVDVDD